MAVTHLRVPLFCSAPCDRQIDIVRGLRCHRKFIADLQEEIQWRVIGEQAAVYLLCRSKGNYDLRQSGAQDGRKLKKTPV